MRTAWSGHLVGTFFGYKEGRLFDLSDGSRWTQGGTADEPACREFPSARILEDGTGRIYLEIEGTSSRVRVTRT